MLRLGRIALTRPGWHYRYSISQVDNQNSVKLLSARIRLDVLHHACHGEIHGQWIIGELARHAPPWTVVLALAVAGVGEALL